MNDAPAEIVEQVPDVLDGERIDRVVAMIVGVTRAVAAELVSGADVKISDAAVTNRSVRVVAGQTVSISIRRPPSVVPLPDSSVDLNVVHSDESIIVVDKQAGIVVHPGAANEHGTLVHALVARFPDLAESLPGDPSRPGVVHRLDAGTSGLLVVARTQGAYDTLVASMADRQVDRWYSALLWGDLRPDKGMIDAPIGRSPSFRTKMAVSTHGKEARTHFEVCDRSFDPEMSYVSVKLETGRTHQIRVHFSAIGHPVAGDARYGGVKEALVVPRVFLHARKLAFEHPATGKRLTFESQLPPDLRSVADALGLRTEV